MGFKQRIKKDVYFVMLSVVSRQSSSRVTHKASASFIALATVLWPRFSMFFLKNLLILLNVYFIKIFVFLINSYDSQWNPVFAFCVSYLTFCLSYHNFCLAHHTRWSDFIVFSFSEHKNSILIQSASIIFYLIPHLFFHSTFWNFQLLFVVLFLLI